MYKQEAKRTVSTKAKLCRILDSFLNISNESSVDTFNTKNSNESLFSLLFFMWYVISFVLSL